MPCGMKSIMMGKEDKGAATGGFLPRQAQGRLLRSWHLSQRWRLGMSCPSKTEDRKGRGEFSLSHNTEVCATCSTCPGGWPSLTGVKTGTQAPNVSQWWRWVWSSGHPKPQAGLFSCATPGLWLTSPLSHSRPQRHPCQDGNVWPESWGGQCWPVEILCLSHRVPPQRASFQCPLKSWTFSLSSGQAVASK